MSELHLGRRRLVVAPLELAILLRARIIRCSPSTVIDELYLLNTAGAYGESFGTPGLLQDGKKGTNMPDSTL